MPIRPEYRWLYPIDWRELSVAIRFKRAGGRCEQCRRPHGKRVRHLGDGRWWMRRSTIGGMAKAASCGNTPLPGPAMTRRSP